MLRARPQRLARRSSPVVSGMPRRPWRYLNARPESAEAHALAAQLALEKGKLDLVTDELNRARTLGYPKPELERLHAVTLARIGRYAEAEPILVRLYAGSSGPDPVVDEALARLYLMTYRLGQAEDVIRRWIDDAPGDGRPYLWLTEIDRRMEVDNLESPARHYRQALARDPDLDAARLGLAETLRKLHHNGEAQPEFTQYLARHPDDPAALVGAGRNAVALGDVALAARFLDRALTIAPDDVSVLKGRASLEMARGQPRDASAWLDRALKVDPYDTESLYAQPGSCRVGRSGGGEPGPETLQMLRARPCRAPRAARVTDGAARE